MQLKIVGRPHLEFALPPCSDSQKALHPRPPFKFFSAISFGGGGQCKKQKSRVCTGKNGSSLPFIKFSVSQPRYSLDSNPAYPPGGHCVVMYMYLPYSRLINAGFSNKQSHSVPAHSLRVTTTVRNARHLASIPTRSPSYATCTSSKDLHTSGLPSRRRRPWAGSSHGPRTLRSRYSHHLQPAAYCTASQIAAFTPTPTSTLARYSSAPLSSRTTISPANRPWSFKA